MQSYLKIVIWWSWDTKSIKKNQIKNFLIAEKLTQQATNLVKTQQQKYNVDSLEMKKIKSNIKSSKKQNHESSLKSIK